MEKTTDEELKRLIEHAQEQGATKEEFKKAIIKILRPRASYRLTGEQGKKRLARDAEPVFKMIDKLWCSERKVAV